MAALLRHSVGGPRQSPDDDAAAASISTFPSVPRRFSPSSTLDGLFGRGMNRAWAWKDGEGRPGVLVVMHDRSSAVIYRRLPTKPGQSTWDGGRGGGRPHTCWRQPRRALHTGVTTAVTPYFTISTIDTPGVLLAFTLIPKTLKSCCTHVFEDKITWK